MEVLKEIFSSISDWVRSRVVNPFFAAFAFAWVSINWRLCLILLSADHYEKKIAAIDHILDSGALNRYVLLIVFPSLLAVIYVIVGPFIMGLFTLYHRRRVNAIKLKLMRTDREKPISRKDRVFLTRQHASLVVRFEELQAQKDQLEGEQARVIDEQNKKIEALEKQLVQSVMVESNTLEDEPKYLNLQSPTATSETLKLSGAIKGSRPLDVNYNDLSLQSIKLNGEIAIVNRVKETTLTHREIVILLALYDADGEPIGAADLLEKTHLTRIQMTNAMQILSDLRAIELEQNKVVLRSVGYQLSEFVAQRARAT